MLGQFLGEMNLGRLGFFSLCFHGVNLYCNLIGVTLYEVCFATFLVCSCFVRLLLGSGFLLLFARSLVVRTSVFHATALLSNVAFPFAFAAFFPIGRAFSGTMFASTSCAVVLVLGLPITGSLGLFAGGLLLFS